MGSQLNKYKITIHSNLQSGRIDHGLEADFQTGLTSEQVQDLLNCFGKNILSDPKSYALFNTFEVGLMKAVNNFENEQSISRHDSGVGQHRTGPVQGKGQEVHGNYRTAGQLEELRSPKGKAFLWYRQAASYSEAQIHRLHFRRSAAL